MSDARQTLVERFTPSGGELGLFIGLFFGTLLASLAVAGFLLVRAPADYFAGAKPPRLPGPRWVRIGLHILKNLLGAGIIALGLLMSIPGVPGQGLLTMLVGLMLIDGPGKRRVERWVVGMPGVLKAANALRRRFGREPLVIIRGDSPRA
ncbi:MAG: hypothetical protein HYY18_21120 [Planctomycetes bacterium]|nr:hypothetical protein [Planctomycetota bacterium]